MKPETPTSRSSPFPTGTVSLRYEIDADEPPSHALATVLAELTGSQATEIGPLGRYVDLEALDQLLGATQRAPPWTTSVRFVYEEYALTIDEAEIVVVTRGQDDSAASKDEVRA